MNVTVCRDTSDAIALYIPQRLFLKPFARITISVQIPPSKVHGKSISNWELMEKLRKMILPEVFSLLKPTKNTPDLIRFEAELEQKDRLERVVSRLDDRTVQLTSYPDTLKIKAAESKSDFPTRHAWDAFFRDAPDMDEMKPGERPDTIHISNMPIRWFVPPHERDEDSPPSENIFKKVFDKFGKIRYVDVPVADPFRMEMKSHMRGIFTPAAESALYFEGYVQYSEYVGFVRAMDALRAMKLLRKRDDGPPEWVTIKVDFDKTKHMTDAAIKRRSIVRERLSSRQRAKEEQEKEERDRLTKREEKERQKLLKIEKEKLDRMREREEKRKKKQINKLMTKDGVDMSSAVAEEEKKLTKTQRKLQAVRLMEELFKRIELRPRHVDATSERERRHGAQDAAARDRLVSKMKRDYERDLDLQRDRLQQAMDGRIVIRSVLETTKPRTRHSSNSSHSSEDERRYKKIKTERMTTPEREDYQRAATMYPPGMPMPYGYPYQFPTPGYPYAPPQNLYYPVRGAYYPPPAENSFTPRPRFPRGRGRGRALYRGGPRFPYFDGPNASHEYYKYFKRLSEKEADNEHDDRHRSRSRSRRRSRSYSRSRSRSRRSRSRSHRRSYTRSRTRSRSRSRRSRHRSRTRSKSRHRDRSRSKSRSRRSPTPRKSRTPRRESPRKSPRRNSNSPRNSPRQDSRSPRNCPEKEPSQNGDNFSKTISPARQRSKSWSLPKDGENRKSWSKSPKEINN